MSSSADETPGALAEIRDMLGKLEGDFAEFRDSMYAQRHTDSELLDKAMAVLDELRAEFKKTPNPKLFAPFAAGLRNVQHLVDNLPRDSGHGRATRETHPDPADIVEVELELELEVDAEVASGDAANNPTASNPEQASPGEGHQAQPQQQELPTLQTIRERLVPDSLKPQSKESLEAARAARHADLEQLRELGVRLAGEMPGPPEDDALFERQEAVRNAFRHAWKGYKQHAWGFDNLKPVSRKGNDGLVHMAVTIVDAIDTAIIMGLPDVYLEAREYIRDKLSLGAQENINLFETVIRMVGGLLSAYDLSGDRMFLDRAQELTDMMMFAFDSPTGLPYGTINLKSKTAYNPSFLQKASSISEVGTLQVEFQYLSRHTGDPKYAQAADRVMRHLYNLHIEDGLYPILIDPDSGNPLDSRVTLGARGDSVYEYFLKQWLLSGNRRSERDWIAEMFSQSVKGIVTHLVQQSSPSNLVYIAEQAKPVAAVKKKNQVPSLIHKMDHLVCFLPGTLILGVSQGAGIANHVVNWTAVAEDSSAWNAALADGTASLHAPEQDSPQVARLRSAASNADNAYLAAASIVALSQDLVKTCFQMYNTTTSGLAPEIVTFRKGQDFAPNADARHSLLRPETVESLFVMHRVTSNDTYRDWGWQIFDAIERHARVHSGGYSGLRDVEDPAGQGLDDNMESFFLAETLKYLYLLFSPDDLIPLDKYVFNTEAHPLGVINYKAHEESSSGFEENVGPGQSPA